MFSSAQRIAKVKVKGETSPVIVPISSNKPDIPASIEIKWQKIVDLVASIMQVPTGLITRLTTENLEIFIASQTEKNPYQKNDKDKLGIGMFCETVAGKRRQMLVGDINDTDYWRNNPHAVFGMHSYLGVPIQWEDGELFGTFCMLNDETNMFTQNFIDLMSQFKEIIETDLKYLLAQKQLEKKLSEKELQLREVHHRIKNHFNLLISFIRLQSSEITDTEVNNILMELQGRIKTISLIHEKLYQNTDCSAPCLDLYIQELCDFIVQDFTQHRIKIHYDIENAVFPLNVSIPIALLISELVTNSIKHAFPGVADPAIEIRIRHTSPNSLLINYQDNGVGLPPSFDLNNTPSMGMRLIRALTDQLNGKIEIHNNKGMYCEIVVPY